MVQEAPIAPAAAVMPIEPAGPVAEPGPTVEPPPALPGGAPARISARHLLVAYDGSTGAAATIRRTRTDAVRRAETLLSELQAGADFGELARKESDGPSAPRHGSLGAFGRGTMHPDFERAAFALEMGAFSGLVETPFGIHIIERRPLVEVQLGHVLVQWEGVRRSSTARTKEEAKAIAETARSRLLSGESLAEVAGALSDGATGVRGGELGWFQKGHVMPEFEPMFELEPGETSKVVETAFGYHVMVRLQ